MSVFISIFFYLNKSGLRNFEFFLVIDGIEKKGIRLILAPKSIRALFITSVPMVHGMVTLLG